MHEDASKRVAGAPPPEMRARKAVREMSRAEQAERMKDILADLAENADTAFAQITAASAFLDRVEGKPVARQINLNQDVSGKTDAELLDDIAKLQAAVGDAPQSAE